MDDGFGLKIDASGFRWESIREEIEAKLKRLGIDVKKDDYMYHPKFKELKQSFVTENRVIMTEAWWVEKNLVGQKRLEKIYGPYAFGIERKLTEEEMKDSEWLRNLADKYPDKQRTPKDIWKYYHRDEGEDEGSSKKGLTKRLEKLGFYVDRFSDTQEKVKLLYYLYCFETEKKVQLGSFLGNPTLENVDDSFVGITTKNGELMSDLKRTIARELTPDYTKKVLNLLVCIGNKWEEQLVKVITRLDYSINGEYLCDLKRISEQLRDCLNTMHEMPEGSYQDSVLETFYLKLSQHENLGREFDIMDVNVMEESEDETLTYYPEIYKTLAYQTIPKNEIEIFLRDNKEELLNLVYEKDKVSSYERQRYDVVVDNVHNFVDMLDENTKANEMEKITKLYVITYMQEILGLDKKQKIENFYYRYKTIELKSLYTELNYGTEARRKSQLALIRRVNRRFYRNAGKSEEAKYALESEMYIDMIISRIYQCDSYEDMLYVHNFFLNLTDTVFLLDKQISVTLKRLNKCIGRKQKGYEWIADSEMMRFFIGTLYDSPIIGDLGKVIGKTLFDAEIKKKSVGMSWPIELTHNYIGEIDNYQLDAFVDVENKQIHMLGFHAVPEGKSEECLKRNCIW
ncbi:MAG: hypothetical protein ACYDEX_09720 [Mobilitalea sp.]